MTEPIEDQRRIVWDFCHHVCVACSGQHRHEIGHVPVNAGQPDGDFVLRCTNCGAQEGPFAGPRQRDEEGRWLKR
ncbi:hypothetical protein VH570_14545 [Sphingobium sp. HT1-2]|uniref:hypothetical protein n=1 Tax=Sphingobium sp. HT1-2 TaxID=3111640 RepID=UPI003C04D766